MYIDFHTHIDFFKDKELSSVYKDIVEHNIKVISCSMDETTYKQNINYSIECPNIIPIFGIHPWSVKSQLPNLDSYDDYIKTSPMIGEIGLDFCWAEDKSAYPNQIEIFKHFVKMGKKFDKFLNVHTKGAEELVFDILKANDMLDRSVIHWYSGDKSTLDKFIDAGCYFTSSVDIYEDKKAQLIAKSIPVHKLLCETDGPTSLEWVNGNYGMPHEIINVYDKVCEIKNIDLLEYKSIVENSLSTITRTI